MSDVSPKLYDDVDDQGVFERVIRADERAKEAHRRLDRHDEDLHQIGQRFAVVEAGVAALNIAVAKLNTKVAMAATIGSLIGGGAIAIIVSFLQPG